ncbi:MAG: alpha-mannosidase [Anaerolineae bacterium]|nr:alpha-mannosidase [Anaerolineae bacterium]
MDERIIAKKLEILNRRAVVRRWPVEGWQVRLATYHDPGEYTYDGEWQVLHAPAAFAALKTALLKTVVDCPSPEAGGKVYLQFDFEDLEGALSVDERLYAGLDRNHKRVPAPPPGERALEIECMSLLRAYCQPELRAAFSSFGGGAFVEVDPAIEAAYYDFTFAWQAARAIAGGRRRERLFAALEAALLQIDLVVPDDVLRAELKAAQETLRKRVCAIAPDPEGGRVYLVGHTHIDTAWLWPLSETVRKCGRTFATALRLMEQYPEFHFSCSQAQLYVYTKKHYPDLYKEIRGWVAKGRWHTTGAMWVESDCNVPSGEALIRQFLYGLEFYEREFGTRPRTCWLPDVFGYPASLPQILQGCGILYFMTCKLHWQATNPFPNHLFWWEGLDGSRVLAHIPRLRNMYNGLPEPEQLVFAWDQFLQKALYDEVMLPFGYGDGGGGVTPEMMEYVRRAPAFPGLPATRTGGEEVYFDDALQHAEPLPTWQGELYLETHRGTYTTQSRTKRANRKCELALREAEIWGSIAESMGADLSLTPLKGAWRRVLTQQFHDILPGSSIGPVYEDALLDYQRAQQAATWMRDLSLRWLADQHSVSGVFCVFNAHAWSRSDPVEAMVPDSGKSFHIVDDAGRACPAQVLGRDGLMLHVLLEPPEVPAMGLACFHVEKGRLEDLPLLIVQEQEIENAFFNVKFDADGAIVSLLDKRCNRELIPEGERANVWQLFQDGPEREAAWNVHDTFEKRQYWFTEPVEIAVLEAGPVRAKLRFERTYRDTRIRLDVMLYRGTPRIDFVADVDWQERQTMLKVAFPVAVRAPFATYEIQFGAVQRPTHRNTSWEQQKFEVAAHRWADLSEAGYGVSLMNDSRYGYDVQGDVLRLTLLRGTEYPDPDADRGRHVFAYSLLPHAGDWTQGETVRRARELNEPMVAVATQQESADAARGLKSPKARSYINVQGRGVIVETFKPAEDGDGWILRLYESHGGRDAVHIHFDRPLARVLACNLVEEPQEEMVVGVDGGFRFSIQPFEIKSFRVRFVT